MEEQLTSDGATRPTAGGMEGAPLIHISQRAKLTLLVMLNVLVQLATRSVPYVAMLGPNGMAAAFNWGPLEVGNILSGFGWAYTFTQIPGAILSQAKGAKYTWLALPGAMCVCCTMMTPVFANLFGWFGAAICRAGVGLAQGPLYPALYNLGGVWFAPQERSRANAIVGAVWPGAQALQNLVTPLMLEGPGWAFAFWVWGLGIMCFMYVFNKYGYDRPEHDPAITAAELKLLGAGDKHATSSVFDAATYFRILKTVPVMGLCVTTFIDGLGTPIFLSYLPQYLVTQLKFPVGSAAAIASLPLFASFAGNFSSGFIADWLVSPAGGGLKTVTVRRCLYVGGRCYYFICGLLLASDISASTAIFIMITQNFADGLNGSGLWCSPFDISREYTGAVMGLINCCGNLTYYAISANLIGYFFDKGRCKLSYDLPDIKAMATFVVPDTNDTMSLDVSGDCQSGLKQCLANNEQAVLDNYIEAHDEIFVDPDEQTCQEMWQFLFVGSGTLALLASLVFAVTARGDNMDHIFSGEALKPPATTTDPNDDLTNMTQTNEKNDIAPTMESANPIAAASSPAEPKEQTDVI